MISCTARTWGLRSALAACLTLAAVSAPVPFRDSAYAQNAAAKAAVDAAKAQGIVGEQSDGLLGFVVPPPNPGIAQAVTDINNGRMQVYRDIAGRTGVTPEAAGQATAQQLFVQIPPGGFYRALNGNWQRK